MMDMCVCAINVASSVAVGLPAAQTKCHHSLCLQVDRRWWRGRIGAALLVTSPAPLINQPVARAPQLPLAPKQARRPPRVGAALGAAGPRVEAALVAVFLAAVVDRFGRGGGCNDKCEEVQQQRARAQMPRSHSWVFGGRGHAVGCRPGSLPWRVWRCDARAPARCGGQSLPPHLRSRSYYTLKMAATRSGTAGLGFHGAKGSNKRGGRCFDPDRNSFRDPRDLQRFRSDITSASF